MLKPPINVTGAPAVSRGFTFVEILIVTALLALIGGVLLLATRQTLKTTTGDQAEAAYYAQLSIFMEMLDRDCRMASRLASTTDGCQLEIPTRNGPQQIAYRRLEQGIERRQGTQIRVFDFGRPLTKGAGLVFRIQEVTP